MTRSDTRLTVLENGKPLSYGFDDLMRYHGFGFPGGVAHAFKVMELALPLLDAGAPPERREIGIKTPFRGPGARDAFEMVTRCLTERRYEVDPGLTQPERGETLQGYVFILSYRGQVVRLRIREGLVRDEFVALARKADRTASEEARLETLKREMADRLLGLQAVEVYDPF